VYRISKTAQFAAAHHLETLPDGHPCGRQHGHSYRVTFRLESYTLVGPGWVVDFGELAALVKDLDHRDLNTLLAFEPTAERLAQYLHECATRLLETDDARVVSVRVSESEGAWAEYEV